ncbi:histidine phosphatase family protein [Deinococcus ruber]|uniref:Phosphoglycerate mutase n=1 Tax=Deinococcus ruber TaxID=1848197 RepID=A0A918FG38_9DEIO|nr:histidine phosphatase family protein [Deinococcus ruber]GGR35734.1 phosphoglycerate mutase [Deinococcus ruber]
MSGGDDSTSSPERAPAIQAVKLPTGFSAPDRSTSTEFWVVRHGESTWNVLGRYQGQTDVPLSLEGRLQASMLAERLVGQTFAAVYSSDLSRALETATVVAERLESAPKVQIDAGLREIDVGVLSGRDTRQIRQDYAEYLEALRLDPWATRRPGGESMEDLFARAGASFQAMRERHPGQRVLVFTHGGVVRVAVGLALGGVPQNAWARLSVTNTSVTRVLLSPEGGTLLGFNDAAHLELLNQATEADDVLGPDVQGGEGTGQAS